MQGFCSQFFRKLLRSNQFRLADPLIQTRRTFITTHPLHNNLHANFSPDTQRHIKNNSSLLLDQLNAQVQAKKYKESVATFAGLKPLGILDSWTLTRYIAFIVNRSKGIRGRGSVDKTTLENLDDILKYAIEHQEVATAHFWSNMIKSYIDLNAYNKAALIADMALSHIGYLHNNTKVLSSLYLAILQARLLNEATFDQCSQIGSMIHEHLEGREAIDELVAVYLIYSVFPDPQIQKKAHHALVNLKGLTSYHSEIILSVLANRDCIDDASDYLLHSKLDESNLPSVFTTVWFLQKMFSEQQSVAPLMPILNYHLDVSPGSVSRLTNCILSLALKQPNFERERGKVERFINNLLNRVFEEKRYQPSIGTANILFTVASRLRDEKWLFTALDLISNYELEPTHVTYRSLLITYSYLPSSYEQITQAWSQLEAVLSEMGVPVTSKELTILSNCVNSQPNRENQDACLEFLVHQYRKYEAKEVNT
ncbi:hypothetical protein SPOG_00917 [Schizosaccharomyces cryophilus OY26]|uniref:Uncharacterized protein n=1 Tax=Schizosaccharomyces cryophilus (strain OY26 / ATCC MYA-4695 / CBS 11777 / NBRC 106824 / NRRL Y48691) TaxID=653667 RepID=S9X8K3_SCHCR|nr:uncharacterized protein SPOG_00917 [Schizosaccharomyces cryophilus OY26]EPY50156.1 hypothetical protein SPOG_00917 [Schizosaccharomyces cryophilus OY26]